MVAPSFISSFDFLHLVNVSLKTQIVVCVACFILLCAFLAFITHPSYTITVKSFKRLVSLLHIPMSCNCMAFTLTYCPFNSKIIPTCDVREQQVFIPKAIYLWTLVQQQNYSLPCQTTVIGRCLLNC